MTKRTFICKGYGVSPTPPTTLTVTLDGVEIFNGPIPTANEQRFFTTDELQQCFSWEMDLDENNWEKPMVISVTGGDFRLGEFYANYIPSYLETQTLTEKQTNFLDAATKFISFFVMHLDGRPDQNTAPVTNPVPATDDPKFNVKIDGVERTKSGIDPEGNSKTGQWHWSIGEDSVITFDLKCKIKPIPAEISNTQAFL